MQSSSFQFRTIRGAFARRSGRGFSLVELLVVIAIISFLALLSLRVMGSSINAAKVKQTQATIKKIQGLIDERVRSYNNYVGKKDFCSKDWKELERIVTGNTLNSTTMMSATSVAAALLRGGNASYPANANGDVKLAQVLACKEVFRKAFPQRLEDTIGGRPAASIPFESESSELLYNAFTTTTVYGVPPVSSDAFGSNELAFRIDATSGQRIYYFVDGWGNPLRFYRWPTRLIRPGGMAVTAGTPNFAVNPAPGQNVPILMLSVPSGNSINFDPNDRLSRTRKIARSATGSTETIFEGAYHTMLTYHVPLVVSCGVDGALGLYEPYDGTNYGYLANVQTVADLSDNITNLNIRAGG